ncbi:MAG: SPOR domain-containing protein [Betaproteobacteria bacterium]|nr:SPOR domain-containing protein [Betaproteobacteria bacterium]
MKLPGKRAKESSRGGESVARQAQSEEVLRLRARRRLIGAVALVLTGVVVFPLIFETQPRPVASNIALIVPPQNQASSVAPPAPGASRAASPTQAAPVAAASPVPQAPRAPLPSPAQVPARAPVQAPVQTPVQTPARTPEPTAQHKPQAQVQPRPAAEPAARPSAQVNQARQALAALEDKVPSQISAAQAERAAQPASGRPAPAASANDRFVVQAGAYADAATARQVRRRIDAAGLHSYTQVVDTPAGKRVRVRVGPFASRSQAEHALQRIRSLGISAAVLSL